MTTTSKAMKIMRNSWLFF